MVFQKLYNGNMKRVGSSLAVTRQQQPTFLFLLASTRRMKSRALGIAERSGDSMKAWAKSFYLSQAWENTRAAYLMSQDYICERCGSLQRWRTISVT